MASAVTGRRDFLRLAGIVGGAVGMHVTGLRRLGIGELQAQVAADEWIPTTCMMCGGTTGVLAHVVNGRVVKIEPNKYNPAGVANMYSDFVTIRDSTSVASGARMCPKGNAAMMSLYDPDRVKKPLKRRLGSARGSGQFDEITYDQALAEIGLKLGEIRTNDPAKLLWFTEDNNFTAIQQAFCNAFDTPNFLQQSNICDVARKVGFETTMGFHRPLPDLKNTKYMLIFGWNPLGAMKWAHLPRILLDGLSNGAKLVLVDPRCSETAEKVFDYGGAMAAHQAWHGRRAGLGHGECHHQREAVRCGLRQQLDDRFRQICCLCQRQDPQLGRRNHRHIGQHDQNGGSGTRDDQTGGRRRLVRRQPAHQRRPRPAGRRHAGGSHRPGGRPGHTDSARKDGTEILYRNPVGPCPC